MTVVGGVGLEVSATLVYGQEENLIFVSSSSTTYVLFWMDFSVLRTCAMKLYEQVVVIRDNTDGVFGCRVVC